MQCCLMVSTVFQLLVQKTKFIVKLDKKSMLKKGKVHNILAVSSPQIVFIMELESLCLKVGKIQKENIRRCLIFFIVTD